jgi:hypothetical protein
MWGSLFNLFEQREAMVARYRSLSEDNGWPVSMSSDRLEGLSTNPSAGRILGISHEIWNPKDHTSITRSYYAISDLQQHGWPVPQYMTYRQSLKRNMSLDGSWDARFRLQTIRLERNIAH